MLVLIIGGRYGTEKSESRSDSTRAFFERYDSITKLEYENAIKNDVPVWILVEVQVYAEYHTFQRNRNSTDISYAHVDSINIFHLIESILAQRRNNPLFAFSRYTEIESWLREQWAGIFRDLLKRKEQSQQLTSLSAQVTELRAINETLKTYLESLMRAEPRDRVESIIETESAKLDEVEKKRKLEANFIFGFVELMVGYEKARRIFIEPESIDQLSEKLRDAKISSDIFLNDIGFQKTLDEIRDILERPRIQFESSNSTPQNALSRLVTVGAADAVPRRSP
jgi:hypothetical protein